MNMLGNIVADIPVCEISVIFSVYGTGSQASLQLELENFRSLVIWVPALQRFWCNWVASNGLRLRLRGSFPV